MSIRVLIHEKREYKKIVLNWSDELTQKSYNFISKIISLFYGINNFLDWRNSL